MSALDARVSMTDLARLADVSIAAVSNWRRRHSDFPSPRCVSGQELFRIADVVAWLDHRKIAKNDLKDGEQSGVTYGVRFLRNLSMTGEITLAPEVRVQSQPVAAWGAPLWKIVNRLRGNYDLNSCADLVLGMVYLRICEPALWRKLVTAATSRNSGRAVWELLDRATLPGDRHRPDIRLFPSLILRPKNENPLGEIISTLDRINLVGPAEDVPPGSRRAADLFSYLLDQLDRVEGLKTGEYFTPPSLVRLMAEMVEPQPDEYVHDPCCGSGEMLAGALAYVESRGSTFENLSISGHALSERSLRLTTLNMALCGIIPELDLRVINTLHDGLEPAQYFDVIVTNPPFNVSGWAAGHVEYRRWPFGVPPAHNANFAWLQDALSKLSSRGRAAILMPNGAASSDNAREATIRAAMVNARVVDCVVALPAQLFRSTGIPVMLWLLRRGDDKESPGIFFVDATGVGSMVDRVQRDLADGDVAQISDEYRRWRSHRSLEHHECPPGISRPASWDEIRERDYMLNPRVYVSGKINRLDVARAVEATRGLRADLRDLHERSVEVDAMVDEWLARVDEWKP